MQMPPMEENASEQAAQVALLSTLMLAELWCVGGTMQLGVWCLHLEGEQRH